MTLMTPLQHFGIYLRSVRTVKGISGKELARITGITRSNISDIECGRRIGSAKTLEKLTQALDLDLVEVFARSGKLPEQVAQYMIVHPNAGRVLQRLVKYNFSDRSLAVVISQIDKLYEIAKMRKEKERQKQITTKINVQPVVDLSSEDENDDSNDSVDNESEEDDFDNSEDELSGQQQAHV